MTLQAPMRRDRQQSEQRLPPPIDLDYERGGSASASVVPRPIEAATEAVGSTELPIASIQSSSTVDSLLDVRGPGCDSETRTFAFGIGACSKAAADACSYGDAETV